MPANQDPETCSEPVLYFIINTYGSAIFNSQRAISHEHAEKDETLGLERSIAVMQEKQRYAAAQLKRFGVTPFQEDGKTPTKDYWQWYRFWDDWKNKMSDEQFKAVDRRLCSGQSLDKYLPKGSWKDAVLTPSS